MADWILLIVYIAFCLGFLLGFYIGVIEKGNATKNE